MITSREPQCLFLSAICVVSLTDFFFVFVVFFLISCNCYFDMHVSYCLLYKKMHLIVWFDNCGAELVRACGRWSHLSIVRIFAHERVLTFDNCGQLWVIVNGLSHGFGDSNFVMDWLIAHLALHMPNVLIYFKHFLAKYCSVLPVDQKLMFVCLYMLSWLCIPFGMGILGKFRFVLSSVWLVHEYRYFIPPSRGSWRDLVPSRLGRRDYESLE